MSTRLTDEPLIRATIGGLILEGLTIVVIGLLVVAWMWFWEAVK